MKRGTTVLALMTDAIGGGGGIAQYNRDLVSGLASEPNIARIEILLRVRPKTAAIVPDKVHQTVAPAGRPGYSVAAIGLALAMRPTIVFCGHLHLAPLAVCLAGLVGAKLVIQLHGVEAWERPPFLQRKAAAAADLIFCVSRFTRMMSLTWADIAPERVVVLPNTVGDAFSPGDRTKPRLSMGLSKACVLLTVGRLSSLERYKGHDRIIRLLPQLAETLNNLVYLIAGDGDDLPRLKALAADCGVAERVRFLDWIPDNNLADLYRSADLFVFPSTGEGFGIVFLEAMACGTPALGLSVGGAPDALGDGNLGVLASEDTLAQLILDALRAPAHEPARLAQRVQARFGRVLFTKTLSGIMSRLETYPPRCGFSAGDVRLEQA